MKASRSFFRLAFEPVYSSSSRNSEVKMENEKRINTKGREVLIIVLILCHFPHQTENWYVWNAVSLKNILKPLPNCQFNVIYKPWAHMSPESFEYKFRDILLSDVMTRLGSTTVQIIPMTRLRWTTRSLKYSEEISFT